MDKNRSQLIVLRTAIVGLGLMGGSMAMALRTHCKNIFGVDSDKGVLEYALSNGIVDAASNNLEEILPKVDLIILSMPVRAIETAVERLPNMSQAGGIVIDLGSTKVDITAKMDKLPDPFEAVGGHPICGKEVSTIYHSDKNLYRGEKFVLVSTDRTTERARQVGEEICTVIGATSVWMDAEEHDKLMAATSHLPYLIANRLAAVVPDVASALSGPGLCSTTRLAGSPIDMMIDILKSNRNNIHKELENYRNILFELDEFLVKEDWDSIEHTLTDGRVNYLKIFSELGDQ